MRKTQSIAYLFERKMPLSKTEITVWRRWYKNKTMVEIMQMRSINKAPFYTAKSA